MNNENNWCSMWYSVKENKDKNNQHLLDPYLSVVDAKYCTMTDLCSDLVEIFNNNRRMDI